MKWNTVRYILMNDKAVRENISQMLRKRCLARAGGATSNGDYDIRLRGYGQNIPDAHENNAGICRQDLLWRGVDHFMGARGRQWFWCHCRPRPQRERVWAGAKGVIRCWRLVAVLLMCSTSSSFRPLRRVSQIIWKHMFMEKKLHDNKRPYFFF